MGFFPWCVYGCGKEHGKAEVQKEKMMPIGRAVMDMGKVLVQLRQWPKAHLSKISTMVQAKRRRPSGICKATARQSRDMSRGLGRDWDGTLPLARPGNLSSPTRSDRKSVV